jgi:myosin heavy subunit
MLLERQEKLVKDESEVNTALQKVTEMLKNQRNLSNQSGTAISEASQSKRSIAEASQSESRVSDASHSKQSKASGKSPSEQSVPEEISSTARSVSEEVKGESAADKTANDYDNATFESDDSTPRSRRSQHLTSQNGEVNVEDELFSLTGKNKLIHIKVTLVHTWVGCSKLANASQACPILGTACHAG